MLEGNNWTCDSQHANMPLHLIVVVQGKQYVNDSKTHSEEEIRVLDMELMDDNWGRGE